MFTKFVLPLVFFAVSVAAKEVSSETPRFKITFPDTTGWSSVQHQSHGAEVQIWAAENPSLSLAFRFVVMNAPMPEAKPTFKENAEEWARGLMERFSRKLSSRFTRLAERDAYELVASLKDGNEELFYSNWMIQVGDVTYNIMIVADDRSKLAGDTALAFLKSLEIPK
jgi:hypothetical protein